MYNNARLKRKVEKTVYKLGRKWRRCRGETKATIYPLSSNEEDEAEKEKFQPKSGDLISNGGPIPEEEEDAAIDEAVETYNEELEMKEHEVVEEALKHAEEQAEEEKGLKNTLSL